MQSAVFTTKSNLFVDVPPPEILSSEFLFDDERSNLFKPKVKKKH